MKLLQKKPRSVEEGEQIYRIMNRTSFFDKMFEKIGVTQERDKILLCRYLEYEKIDAGTLLAKQNTKANLKLFFSLKGDVAILRESDNNLAQFSDAELEEMNEIEMKIAESFTSNKRFSGFVNSVARNSTILGKNITNFLLAKTKGRSRKKSHSKDVNSKRSIRSQKSSQNIEIPEKSKSRRNIKASNKHIKTPTDTAQQSEAEETTPRISQNLSGTLSPPSIGIIPPECPQTEEKRPALPQGLREALQDRNKLGVVGISQPPSMVDLELQMANPDKLPSLKAAMEEIRLQSQELQESTNSLTPLLKREHLYRSHQRAKYHDMTFTDIEHLLLKVRSVVGWERFLSRIPRIYYNFLKKYLGPLIRELEEASIFGERALDGESTRTASVVAVTSCEFIVLGAKEYIDIVKTVAKSKKKAKEQMLNSAFPGIEEWDFETYFQFQFAFEVCFLNLA